MNRVVAVLLLSLGLLTSCSKDHSSYHYFLMHPTVAKAQFERCAVLPPAVVQADPVCTNVIRAALELRTLTTSAAYTQLDFGLRLMDVETKLVDLQQQLSQSSAKDSHYQQTMQQYQQLEQRRDLYLLVIRLVRNNM